MSAPGTTPEPASGPGPGEQSPAWHWLLLGCALQGAVFVADGLTPLGFAHGVLYMPAVMLGLLARSHRAVWTLVALGVAGGLLGIWASPGRLPGISDSG